MIYSLLITGFDPTSLPDTPTNAELLQMISQAQYSSDIGGIILSDTEPDSTTYPILLRFRWSKTDGSGGLTGEFYYHDGTSWTLEVPGPGTVTAASLAAGTITLDKFYAGGDPFWIIRRNSIAEGSPGAGFEMISITNAISSNSLSLGKLVNSGSAGRFITSGSGGVWTDTPADDAFTVLFQSSNGVTAFTSLSDELFFMRISDDAPCSLTLQNFFTSGLGFLTTITTTQNSDVVTILDASDSLIAKTVVIGNLLPDTGVTAATYAYPTSVSVNAKGQLTAITAGTAPLTPSGVLTSFANTFTLPIAGAGDTVIPHSLTVSPNLVEITLICLVSEFGYAANDEIQIQSAESGFGGSPTGDPIFRVCYNATNIYIRRPSAVTSIWTQYGPASGTIGKINLTEANWRIRVKAVRFI